MVIFENIISHASLVTQNKLRAISNRITEIPPCIIFTKGVDTSVKNVNGDNNLTHYSDN